MSFLKEGARLVHSLHLSFVQDKTKNPVWIRSRPIELETSIVEGEIDGHPDGFVDLALLLCEISLPGFPPFLGVGLELFPSEEGSSRVEGVAYYYSAFEILEEDLTLDPEGDGNSNFQKFSEDEVIISPPKWLIPGSGEAPS